MINNEFTFHYGRIQSQLFRYQGRYNHHLHSIMVGFNREPQTAKHGIGEIYIPLWSDSIAYALQNTTQCMTFTFHYGRIQSSFDFCFLDFRLIYIPLWSDSISSPSLFPYPVCEFTFHYGRIQSRRLRRVPRPSHSFTFHYGRIQSAALGTAVSAFQKFTFHYGRIQSACFCRDIRCSMDLHSIMVGFNRIA